ncbi:hypothetical protein [Hafnia alvei]|uniref:hypothetical protein n=1 Tax=Hafnia alvei TaxID=569 RepID=UPI00214B6653|nr:hypothetical protein [Hafnia alvei]
MNAKAAIYAVETEFEAMGIELPVMISGTITDASGVLCQAKPPKRFITHYATSNR